MVLCVVVLCRRCLASVVLCIVGFASCIVYPSIIDERVMFELDSVLGRFSPLVFLIICTCVSD